MIQYIENPKDATQKQLEFINKFCKFEAWKINIQKSVGFLYNNNQLSKKEIKEKISFTLALKKKNLCSETYEFKKTPFSETYETDERNQRHRKVHCVHGLEELILLKWSYYPRQSI